jgi:hypothetical protein
MDFEAELATVVTERLNKAPRVAYGPSTAADVHSARDAYRSLIASQYASDPTLVQEIMSRQGVQS